MAKVTIQENIWDGLVHAAKKRRQKPEALAGAILRDFLQSQADEDLLQRSSLEAQKSAFPIRDTEEIIRQHRKRKKKP